MQQLQPEIPMNLTLGQYIQIIINIGVGFGAGVLAKHGWDTNSAASLMGALGGVVGIVVAAIIQRLGLLNTQVTSTDTTTTTQTTIKTPVSGVINKAPLVLLLLLPLLGLSGCTTDPTIRLQAAEQTITAANSSAALAIKTRLITDPKTIAVIKASLDKANGIVHSAYASTQPSELVFWIDQAEAEAPDAVKLIAAAEAQKAGK